MPKCCPKQLLTISVAGTNESITETWISFHSNHQAAEPNTTPTFPADWEMETPFPWLRIRYITKASPVVASLSLSMFPALLENFPHFECSNNFISLRVRWTCPCLSQVLSGKTFVSFSPAWENLLGICFGLKPRRPTSSPPRMSKHYLHAKRLTLPPTPHGKCQTKCVR